LNTHRSFIALAVIVPLHIAGLVVAEHSLRPSVRSTDERIATVFIQPKIGSGQVGKKPELSRLAFLTKERLQAIHVNLPSLDFEVERNAGSAISAPTPMPDNQTDMAAYVARATLRPGEGATVILRVEVLETGTPGRIEIDASSGSRWIDQAAIDYARTQRWYPGRTNGKARVMWIRWGVRLQT
jgi:TonB family protein